MNQTRLIMSCLNSRITRAMRLIGVYVGAASITLFVGQPVLAQQSSLLSDLEETLSQSSASESTTASPRDDQNPNAITLELKSISDRMLDASEAIRASDQRGERFLEAAINLQADIVRHLDAFLLPPDDSGNTKSQSVAHDSNSSEAENSTEQQQRIAVREQQPKNDQSSAEQPREGDAQATTPDSGNSADSTGTGSDATSVPASDEVKLAQLREDIVSSGRARWGKLPEQIRNIIGSSNAADFAKGYELETSEYFKKLNRTLKAAE